MIVIGLTGSIGMGKSTVAKMFEEEGAPAFNSDDAVHALYAPGGAGVAPVAAAFPGVEKDGGISAVTNCGGFKRAFQAADVSECGLLPTHERAVAVRDLLRKEYPNEPHATDCTLWAIWRL